MSILHEKDFEEVFLNVPLRKSSPCSRWVSKDSAWWAVSRTEKNDRIKKTLRECFLNNTWILTSLTWLIMTTEEATATQHF